MPRITAIAFVVALSALGTVVIVAQRPDSVSARHPAIDYRNGPTTDAVADLNRRIAGGDVQLAFSQPQGYLRSVLDALHVPVESQMLVFSETSLQSEFITHATPRALYFNDRVAVGWSQGSGALEVAALDPQQGTMFYWNPSNDEHQFFPRTEGAFLAVAAVPGVPRVADVDPQRERHADDEHAPDVRRSK